MTRIFYQYDSETGFIKARVMSETVPVMDYQFEVSEPLLNAGKRIYDPVEESVSYYDLDEAQEEYILRETLSVNEE